MTLSCRVLTEIMSRGRKSGRPISPSDRTKKGLERAPHRSLNSQRGDGWPPSPKVDIPQIEWTQERKI